MPGRLVEICGWLPALIIPAATLFQLGTILRRRSAENVNALTWALFGVANVGLYVYAEKYDQPQAILAFLGTAAIDLVIAALALRRHGAPRGR
jgi:hypothetical protein